MHYDHLVLTVAGDVRRMRQDEWELLNSKMVLDDVLCKNSISKTANEVDGLTISQCMFWMP